MEITKQALLYEGKAKSLYTTNDDALLIVSYRDDMTAFNGVRHEVIESKGLTNNAFNAFFMDALANQGVPSHYIKQLNNTECLVKKLDMLPVESVMRNHAAGSLTKRLGIPELTKLTPPLQEFFLKDDALNDPIISEEHAVYFGWATLANIKRIKELTHQINAILFDLFDSVGLLLVDAKYEFGILDGEVVLGDEISPDSCRILDGETMQSLDKDVFRNNIGDVMGAYHLLANRLAIDLPV